MTSRIRAVARAKSRIAVLPAVDSPASRGSTALPSSAAGFSNPVFDADFPDPMIVEQRSVSWAVATNGSGANVQNGHQSGSRCIGSRAPMRSRNCRSGPGKGKV